MAQAKNVILALDSGALIQAEKNTKVEAILRKWIKEGAEVVIPAPCLTEVLRGSARDAAINRLIKAVRSVLPLTETTARVAGALLGRSRRGGIVDAMIVAAAQAYEVTDILTTDSADITSLAGATLNVIAI